MRTQAPEPDVAAGRERRARVASHVVVPAARPSTQGATIAPAVRDDALGQLLQRSVLARKSEAERGREQRDKAHGRRTIALLRNNLKQACDDHLFLGVPLEPVGPIVPSDPKGVHAYTSAGTLPAGVRQIDRRGAKGKVHQIDWHWAGQAPTTAKPSTMFPCWMPPDHVRTLIQLTYPNSCATPLATIAGLPANASTVAINAALHADATKRYITRNTEIQLQQLGSGTLKSYYPVDP